MTSLENAFVLRNPKRNRQETAFDAYNSSRRDGLIAINLNEDDELVRVIETSGTDDIFMVAKSGMTIRFNEGDVRAMGAQRPVFGYEVEDRR